MQITKKEFVSAMVENQTVFCGCTRRLYSKDETYCAIRNLLTPGIILEKRTCKARSKDLEFTGKSYLDLTGKTFTVYEYTEGKVYAAHMEKVDEWGELYENTCYYLVA